MPKNRDWRYNDELRINVVVTSQLSLQSEVCLMECIVWHSQGSRSTAVQSAVWIGFSTYELIRVASDHGLGHFPEMCP
jgi:hypothetical protein